VTRALQGLPCVDKDTIKVDVVSKQAEFSTIKGEKCDIEEVKQKIVKAGEEAGRHFTVTDVKHTPTN
jgi:hypothetical protein